MYLESSCFFNQKKEGTVFISVDWKNAHLRAFLFGDLTEDNSRETASLIALRNYEETGEGPDIYELFARKKHVVKHKKITANHRRQTSQVNDFSVFLCMKDAKNLGSLKFFLR